MSRFRYTPYPLRMLNMTMNATRSTLIHSLCYNEQILVALHIPKQQRIGGRDAPQKLHPAAGPE